MKIRFKCFGILIATVISYLYVLNGRYSHVLGVYYFDKWSREIIKAPIQKEKRECEITTSDGKTHDVSQENMEQHGMSSYAENYQNATIHMKDNLGQDYDIPLDEYEGALESGLSVCWKE